MSYDGYQLITLKDNQGQIYKIQQLQYQQKISGGFCIFASFYADDFNLKANLGQLVTIKCDTQDNHTKFYQGYIVKINQSEASSSDNQSCYELILKSWLDLLDKTNNYWVYQDRSVKELLIDMIQSSGFAIDYKFKGIPDDKIPYSVQYGESLNALFERLVACVGFVYFFEQTMEGMKLIVQSGSSQFDYVKMRFFDYVSNRQGEYPVIDSWRHEMQFHAGKTAVINKVNNQSKSIEKKSSHKIANNNQLIQKSLTSSLTTDKSLTKTEISLAKLEQVYDIYTLKCQGDHLEVGKCFTLANHHQENMQQDYLIIEVSVNYQAGNAGGYSCQTEGKAIPRNVPYYPPTQKPHLLHGVHKATVIGGEKGEIVQDEQGRVKVKFDWNDKDAEQCTCYIPVMQSAHGQFIPRAMQEVFVSFIDGKAEYPVITGSAFNDNKLIFNEETISGFKTQLEGESNEIIFDDKKDEEILRVSAAKTLELDSVEDCKFTIGGVLNEKVTGNILLKTEGFYQLLSDTDILAKSQKISLTADNLITLSVGSSSINISASEISINANSIKLNAINDLSLVSSNFENKASVKHTTTSSLIDISSTGPATFKGMTVNIDAQMNFTAQGAVAAEIKSNLMTTISSSAITEVKGLLIKVN